MATTATLFKSRLPSCSYAFSRGGSANFVNGKYATSKEVEIRELTEEIKAGNQYLYIDPTELTVDYDYTNPMEELKKKFYKEFLAEQEKVQAAQAIRDLGVAVQGTLKATNTVDMQAVTRK